MPRRSGRYPWGTSGHGEGPPYDRNPEQRNTSFSGKVKQLRSEGMSDTDIARNMGMTTSEFRNRITLDKEQQRASNVAQALRLKQKGVSQREIARRMNTSESNVRNWLKPATQEKANITKQTVDALKDQLDKHEYLDVGVGTEQHLGISRTRLKAALQELKDQGYEVYNYIPVEQAGVPGKFTNNMVLTKPGVQYKEVAQNKNKISSITAYSEDGGRTYLGIEPPKSISSKRVDIAYNSDMDGVIQLRRGPKELSMGDARYAQVRIAVDGTHYMKGMAIYSDSMPDGVDFIYHTNKSKGSNKTDVMKSMKEDIDNQFGAIVRQRHYTDDAGNRELSPLNIVGNDAKSNEEGNWGKWSKTISSQVLSKQSPKIAERQLNLAYELKRTAKDDIDSVTNPTVKRKLLYDFADECDSAAVHLKAAGFPRQAYHVILPAPGIKEDQIYAPNYKNGERVVLIRSPHGGIFEIPELTVNNNTPIAKKLFPGRDASDAVLIHPAVAQKLSGADFDGDTVIVIPNNNRQIKTAPALEALKDFDPKIQYPLPDSAPRMKNATKQNEMGKVSNLITDMSIQGASPNEIARAVRHSMVVIDAENHHLDYKQSYIDNGIAELSKRYQGKSTGGASTLISRANSEIRVNDRTSFSSPNVVRRPEYSIDRSTGKKVYKETGRTYINKDGKTVIRKTKTTRMMEEEDARALSSGTQMEKVYADYANKMKRMGDTARKEAVAIKDREYSPSAKATYSKEVDRLTAALNLAIQNKPAERQAQRVVDAIVTLKKQQNPGLTGEALKKVRSQALTEARTRSQAKKTLIEISDREWEAIQAGAVSASKLTQILNNADTDRVKELATPKRTVLMTTSKTQRAKAMMASGNYTQAQIAEALGVSLTTLKNAL